VASVAAKKGPAAQAQQPSARMVNGKVGTQEHPLAGLCGCMTDYGGPHCRGTRAWGVTD
jgi:hypothetical protein